DVAMQQVDPPSAGQDGGNPPVPYSIFSDAILPSTHQSPKARQPPTGEQLFEIGAEDNTQGQQPAIAEPSISAATHPIPLLMGMKFITTRQRPSFFFTNKGRQLEGLFDGSK
ncbi:hypothetical protein HK097_006634, partial [Rhizophlyctis rosea]